MSKTTVALAILVPLLAMLLTPQPSGAKAWPGRQEKVLGVGLKTSFPFDDFGDRVNTGWGVAALLDYPVIPFIDATAEVGYSHFPDAGQGDGVDVWDVIFGARFALGVFFMGGETGYFSFVDEWSFVPSMGLRFGSLEGSVRFKAVGGGNWSSLRLGYYF